MYSVSQNGIFNGLDAMTDGLSVEGFSPVREDMPATSTLWALTTFKWWACPCRGREFDERDSPGSQPSVIINQTMARFYFGNSDPLGKWIQEDDQRFTIVGVVRDMRENELKGEVGRRLYWPVMRGDQLAALDFEIRTHSRRRRHDPGHPRELRRSIQPYRPRIYCNRLVF